MSARRWRMSMAVMASFLIETFVAQGEHERFAVAADGLGVALAAMVDPTGQVHYVRSYLVPKDELGVHVVEAESAEIVMRLAKLAGIEVERIVSAVGVDPGRAEDGRKGA